MIQQPFDLRSLRPLSPAAYAVAAMLVLIPLVELGSALGWDLHPGVLNWRTGAVGLLSGAVLTPTLGLFLAILTASLFGHRWAQRGLSALSGLGALALLAILVVFTLDGLQLRPDVAANMQRSFTLAMVKAVIAFMIAIATLLTMSVGAWFAARNRGKVEARAERRTARTDMPLVRAAQQG